MEGLPNRMKSWSGVDILLIEIEKLRTEWNG